MTQPATTGALGSTWPSRIQDLLTCPLRVAFDLATTATADPHPSPPASWRTSHQALLGTTVHRCIELVLRSGRRTPDEYTSAWEATCDDMVAKGRGDPRATPGFRRTFLRLLRRLPTLVDLVDEDEWEREPMIEEPLSSKDGLFRGQPDLVLIGKRRILVVDYKSGLVTGDEGPRDDYRDQLLLYAHLSSEALEIDAVDAYLLSLREGFVEVDVSEDRRNEYIASAMRAIAAFNKRESGPQPAQPSEEACRWCAHLCSCDEAGDAIDGGQLLSPRDGQAVEGQLLGQVAVADNGRGSALIRVTRGTLSGEVTLGDIPEGVVRAMELGDQVRAVGLRMAVDGGRGLAWSDHKSTLVVQ